MPFEKGRPNLHNQMKNPVKMTMWIDKDLLNKIKEIKGVISASAFVRQVVEEAVHHAKTDNIVWRRCSDCGTWMKTYGENTKKCFRCSGKVNTKV